MRNLLFVAFSVPFFMACSAAVEEGGESLGARTDDLYYLTTRVWTNKVIPVCWTQTGFATEKGWVRDAIINAWAGKTELTFTGWGDCSPSSTGFRLTPGSSNVTSGLGSINGTSSIELDFGSAPESNYTRCIRAGLNREQCIRATATHEFGHGLAFAHEQNRPDRPASCTDPTQGSNGNATYGAFDMSSIMNYCGANTAPSATDYSGAIDIYGPEQGMPLRQTTSGSCIHPSGGALFPANGTPAVLWNVCTFEPRLELELTADGSVRHAPSGLCLHPEGGAAQPADGTRLVFYQGCSEDRLKFTVTSGGSLKHVASGKCVHPRGGSATPANGTELVLFSGCDEPRLKFEPVFPQARIAHSSGLCIHPEGGSSNPSNGTRAVLYNSCVNESRLTYRLTAAGSIQHVSSGKCLHPSGGSSNPSDGTELVFYDGCDEPRLAFEVTPRGSLRHIASGKCVHPQGGAVEPTLGTQLVFFSGCDEDRLRFSPVTF